MMNSQVFLYFSVILVIWSSYAASYPTVDQDIGEGYQKFNGEMIHYDDERHPFRMCANETGDERSYWLRSEEECANNIRCVWPNNESLPIELYKKPLNGTVCGYFRTYDEFYSVCIDGKCVDQFSPFR